LLAASKHQQLKKEAEIARHKSAAARSAAEAGRPTRDPEAVPRRVQRLAERRIGTPDPAKFDLQKQLEDRLAQLEKEIYKRKSRRF